MVLTIPDSLKIITPFIRRAEELDKDASSSEYRVVSYYCKKHALEQAIKLKINSPEVSAFITNVLTSLEKEKPGLGITTDQAPAICENFAFTVFSRADDEDRQGLSTKITAKVFYSAATFYDILEQFGELDAEAKEKRKYCKWKAAEILNAIKEGRQPAPGGFAETVESSIPTPQVSSIPEAPTNTPSMPPSLPPFAPFQSPAPPAYPNPMFNIAPPPFAPAYPQPSPVPNYQSQYASAPPSNRPAPSNQSDPRVKDAIEFLSFAIASLKQNDVNGGKDRIQEALRRLNS